MARKIDFTKTGGFPLTQDTLDYMQKQVLEDVVRASYSHLLIEDAGKFILGGAVQDGLNISSGWLVVDGELLQLLAGSGSYITINENQQTVVFEDNTSNIVYTQRWAEVSTVAAGNIRFSDFQKVPQHKKVLVSDCNFVFLRTHTYGLPKFTTSIDLDDTGNTTNGFLINKITPFDGIPNGFQLLVRCGGGTGLTYLTVNSVESNFLFNRAEFNSVGDQILKPYFSTQKFIGTNNNAFESGGYANNLQVLFSWSESLGKWVEISRSSGSSI